MREEKKPCNCPTTALTKLDGYDFVGTDMQHLLEGVASRSHKKPQSIEELRERIDSYFAYCQNNNVHPGIEQLCFRLCVSRQGLLDWCNGKGRGKDPEWAEACQEAKQFIYAFLELVHEQGKINPVSAIFLLKTWAGYKESIEITNGHEMSDLPTAEEIARRIGVSTGKRNDSEIYKMMLRSEENEQEKSET